MPCRLEKSSWLRDSSTHILCVCWSMSVDIGSCPPKLNSDNVVAISKMVPKGNLPGRKPPHPKETPETLTVFKGLIFNCGGQRSKHSSLWWASGSGPEVRTVDHFHSF